MAELKAPANYMELSSGCEHPSMGDPPIRMLFTDIGNPTLTERMIAESTASLGSRVDAMMIQIEDMKAEIEWLSRPWYRRLRDWLFRGME